MADIHTKEQRSRNMAAIKGHGNASTELRLIRYLRRAKIFGWNRHYEKLPGKPDIVFREFRLAIFLDGCFWHGCPKCRLRPATNRKFWNDKIRNNRARDKRMDNKIRTKGWRILHFWEHDIKKNPQKIIIAIKKYIKCV